jgi:hypothetical protein
MSNWRKAMCKKLPNIELGTVFGELTVLYRDLEYEKKMRTEKRCYHQFYHCLCNCGNETVVDKYNLIRGITRSCGCIKKKMFSELAKRQVNDLTGRTFGSLNVIRRDTSKATGCGRHTYWTCLCLNCGKEKSARGSDLISGVITDCGCGKGKRVSDKLARNLSGETFGNLYVLERDYTAAIGSGGGHHARWLCKCGLCGRKEVISSDVLLYYGKDRCSHCSGMSNGEEIINDILESNGISFIRNRSIDGCKYSKTNYSLRFDFIISDYDNLDTYIIEFDGIQHYKEVWPWESKINLEGRIERDSVKNKWCIDNNIPLIRIPYTHLRNICLKDLTPSTTEFLI